MFDSRWRCAVVAVVMCACSSSSDGNDADDAGDATVDSPIAIDTGTDAPVDAASDVVVDVVADAASDAAFEGGDASGDAGPVCGDGIVTTPEVCDDYNASACGTCSSNCLTSQPLVAASGTITAVSGSNLADGETFTLSDGTQTATVFEFDSNNSVTSGHVAVAFFLNGTASVVATAMRTAINGVGGTLLITASGTGSTVSLTNDQQGSFGNVAITETVSNAGFTVAGMSAGVGADCTSGTGCGGTMDCQLGLTCNNHHCQ